jgi:heat shock protein HslJ
MRQLVGFLVLGLVLAVVGACSVSGGDDDGDSAMVPTTDDLAHHVFEGADVEGEDVPPGIEEVRLSFSEEGMSGTAGCNETGFDHRIHDGVLQGTPTFSTAIGCGLERSRADQWLDDLIEDGVDVRLDGDVLVLEDGDVRLRLDRWASPSLDDPHVRWGMSGYGRPAPEQELLAGAFNPTITFRGDGTVLLQSRCGDHAWPVDIDDEAGALTFGKPHGTDELCPTNAITMERFIQRVFTGTATFEQDGQQLTVTNGERRLYLGD